MYTNWQLGGLQGLVVALGFTTLKATGGSRGEPYVLFGNTSKTAFAATQHQRAPWFALSGQELEMPRPAQGPLALVLLTRGEVGLQRNCGFRLCLRGIFKGFGTSGLGMAEKDKRRPWPCEGCWLQGFWFPV